MGELAVGSVSAGPLVEQRQNLGLFPLQQTVDRVPARHSVIEAEAGLAAGVPPPGPLTIQPQHRTRTASGPAASDRVIDDREEFGFHGP